MQQGNGSFRLIVRRGPQPNQVHELVKDVITMGRDITNDVVINDPEVSRHHCRLTRTSAGYTLEDLGSTNGTFVNGQRLSGARPLANGDMIGLGETVMMAFEGAFIPASMMGDQTVLGAPSPGAGVAPARGYPPPPPPQKPPQVYAQPQQPYAQPFEQSYQPGQPYRQPPPGQAGQQEAAYYPPGYYEEERQGGSNTLRYVLLGCGFVVVLCVVAAIAAVIIIDYGKLWCDIPLGPTIVQLAGGVCP